MFELICNILLWLGLLYAYFFNEHWGLSLGVGFNRIGAKASISKSGVIRDYDEIHASST